jgi:hypothetical protein
MSIFLFLRNSRRPMKGHKNEESLWPQPVLFGNTLMGWKRLKRNNHALKVVNFNVIKY